jgi:hypothetical protein
MAGLEKCLTGLHFGRCRKREQQEFRRILVRWNSRTESGLSIRNGGVSNGREGVI